ncbi:hypothetical protein BDB00DRAFT_861434 [Zychaea mexicana]|uniref:uncharacterized protein n=1 Tax=Zychaea mexicana TaxID=64656 RepID=UPI0022FF2A01|nr:uncharacterized protein BDB00DRAFT_861434 [Zychaea mexicana]KAI9472891.1 hypothetical protein BDB00DRAFT_861434 [Zychaea mexicana]
MLDSVMLTLILCVIKTTLYMCNKERIILTRQQEHLFSSDGPALYTKGGHKELATVQVVPVRSFHHSPTAIV